MPNKRFWAPILAALLVTGLLVAIIAIDRPARFDGQRAYQDVVAQVAFGPRLPDSPAHQQTIEYILDALTGAGWQATLQETSLHGFPILNIIAVRDDRPARILLGAHYDSRLLADQDVSPAAGQAVPGANDGASGVAVLLELARVLPADTAPVMLVFFDAEDNGGLEGRDWIMGSQAFVGALTVFPDCAVIVDMVGDADLNLPKERNSDPDLAGSVWDQAARLGYSQFVDVPGYSMIDDHSPFLQAGIPALDIIDFDYPYWHTSADLPDKVSADSLRAVGDTLLHWIVNYP